MQKEHARILCVDQDSQSLKTFLYLLRSEKYHVLAAATFSMALEVIRKEQRLDMAVFHFPETNVSEEPGSAAPVQDQQENEFRIAETLREKDPKIPILFVLPKREQELIQKVSAVHNSEILHPPCEPSYFLFIVKNGLEGGYLLSDL